MSWPVDYVAVIERPALIKEKIGTLKPARNLHKWVF